MSSNGKLKVRESGKVTIASFQDAAFLDETSIKVLGDQLETIVKEKQGIQLVISFKGVDYLSSAVLGRLVKIFKLVKASHGKMKLCDLKKSILQVFKITKLDKMFEIHDSESKAVKSFGGAKKKRRFKFFWQK